MKMEASNIFPMAFLPTSNLKQRVYYFGIPEKWKEEILSFEEIRIKKEKTTNNVFTKTLKLSLDLWADNIVKIYPLNLYKENKKWIISYKKNDIYEIFTHIKIWIENVYGQEESLKERVKSFLANIKEEELIEVSGYEDIEIFDENKMIKSEYSYDLVKFYIADLLMQKNIMIDGKNINFNYAGDGKFVSDIQGNGDAIFSYGIIFSMKTIPPLNKPMILCDCKIHRWISGVKKEEKRKIYFKDNINARIWNKGKICEIPIRCKYSRQTKSIKYYWGSYEERCYNSYGGHTLPEVEKVLFEPEKFIEKITLPYRNTLNSSGFKENEAGSGASIKEKSQIFYKIAGIIKDSFIPITSVEKLKNKSKVTYSKLKLQPKKEVEKEEKRKFRKRIMECLKEDKLNIEIYSNDTEEDNYCVEQIYSRLLNIVNNEEAEDKFEINIIKKSLGNFGMPLNFGNKKSRIEEIKMKLKEDSIITASIILLPEKEKFCKIGEDNDPKDAIRIGFALCNRVTQFITPWKKEKTEESEKILSKIDSTIADLFRQLGYLAEIKSERKDLKDTLYIGMYSVTLKNDYPKKIIKHPIFIEVDFKNGDIFVESAIFGKLPYRKALIELAKFSFSKELLKKAENNNKKFLEKKIERLIQLYENRPVIFLVESFKNTNDLFRGIKNTSIAKYKYIEKYIPEEIDIGYEDYELKKELINTTIRIIRVKQNEEIPDYITSLKDKTFIEHVNASGILKYEDIFWIIQGRPKEAGYTDSYKKTSIENPKQYRKS